MRENADQDTGTSGQDPDIMPRDAIVAYAFDCFITPILWLRRMNGEELPDQAIVSFLIFLGREVADMRVQLNDEARAWTVTRATRNIGPGETLGPGDLASDHVLLPARPDTGYISGERADDAWRVDFNFEISSPRRDEHLLAADEFRCAARHAACTGLERPLAENAFLAVEHLARAELLSYGPTSELVEKAKTHPTVASTYNSWARLGNTDQRFARLLNNLGAVRGAAVYANNDGRPVPRIDPAILDVIDEMYAHVERIRTGNGPNPIQLIAARDLEAGALVGSDDYTLRAAKGAPRG